MFIITKIEKKITEAMSSTFKNMADRIKAVHAAAAAGAGIVAALPIGVDAWALRAAEIAMVVCIASSYGEKLTKSAAKGLMLSSFAQLAGGTAAVAALEALEAGKMASAPTGAGPAAAYIAKSAIAVGLIEAVGNLVIAYYEDPDSLGGEACRAAEKVGAMADLVRIGMAVEEAKEEILSGEPPVADPENMSFGSSNAAAIEEAERKAKQYKEYFESDELFGRDSSANRRNWERWKNRLDELVKKESALR